MNQDKVEKLIKKIRKDNKLTQKELADSLGVTYQAVSKWENGKNLPDISLLMEICNKYHVDINEVLDNKKMDDKKSFKLIIIIGIIVLVIIIIIILILNNNKTFEFKQLASTCSNFKVSGVLAYDKNKSSIYISNIDYCGETDNNIYEKIECNLYEKVTDTSKVISSCKEESNISLNDYLENIKLNIDNYEKQCKTYNKDSLYLEINAYVDGLIKTYKIPLDIDNSCK